MQIFVSMQEGLAFFFYLRNFYFIFLSFTARMDENKRVLGQDIRNPIWIAEKRYDQTTVEGKKLLAACYICITAVILCKLNVSLL